jgi:hypothetical protein
MDKGLSLSETEEIGTAYVPMKERMESSYGHAKCIYKIKIDGPEFQPWPGGIEHPLL